MQTTIEKLTAAAGEIAEKVYARIEVWGNEREIIAEIVSTDPTLLSICEENDKLKQAVESLTLSMETQANTIERLNRRVVELQFYKETPDTIYRNVKAGAVTTMWVQDFIV